MRRAGVACAPRSVVLLPGAPLIREDKAGQSDNLASPTWEAGDAEATDRAFAEADTGGRAGTSSTRAATRRRCGPAG